MSRGTEKIYRWKCPKCGKRIVSIYPEQYEVNVKLHSIFCKGKPSKRG
jgi:hypothetical protein